MTPQEVLIQAADLSRTDVWKIEAIQRIAEDLGVPLPPPPYRVLPLTE